ncbi:MAG: tol-pal system protein YbgF [Desulfobacteraceae bacterium]|nr:tol-pal system protein YbgF [Desulfobacteraceae bacterium]
MKKFLLCMLGMILVSGCVTPDQYQLLENRLTALEKENTWQASARKERSNEKSQVQENLENFQLKLDNSTKINRENYAEVKDEIRQIKVQFQQVEGLIEEINHNFGTNSQAHKEELEKRLERLDNAISRNYEKVINLEKYMGFEPTDAKLVDTDSKPLVDPEMGSEEESYALAKKTFDDGDKENARIQFENFITKYPDSKNADNARFWIADSYYAEKWYEKAILEYQKVLENYPDSNKTAAARLKQGYSFAELGETANARLILKELIKRHPESNEAKYARKKLKSLN